jgi:hypothetical protein
MRVGIVGAEESKFTAQGEAQAREIIRQLLSPLGSILCSGGCHLGGVDIWAEEEADKLSRDTMIFKPEQLSWPYYKKRNMEIAVYSDIVHCITVDHLPNDFSGMRFSHCYHCGTSNHVKSGGCWTMKKARAGQLHIVSNGS